MVRRLTHLNALLAFETSARTGSFTRAAEELGVTPAAVGQQVRVLEAYVGHRLFERTRDGLKTTPQASVALADLQAGFARLETGLRNLSGPTVDDQVTVSVAPALAAKWLAPRLQRLYERTPEIDLRIDTSLRLADVAGGEFDMAIRYAIDAPKDLTSVFLFREHILPVCAPSLTVENPRVTPAHHIASLPLLHIEGETTDKSVLTWADWGKRHGITRDWLSDSVRFPHSSMALEAAINGHGVVLCGLTLVIDDLLAGRLVVPTQDGGAAKTRSAYRLVYSPARPLSPSQRAFVSWIKAEAKRTSDAISAFLAAT